MVGQWTCNKLRYFEVFGFLSSLNTYFVYKGETWRWHRKLINPSFHVEVLNTFMKIFNEQSQTYARILRERSPANQQNPLK